MQYLKWLKEHRLQLISAAVILVLLVFTFSLGGSKAPGDNGNVQDASSMEAVSASTAENAEVGTPAILQAPGSGAATGAEPVIAPPAASAAAGLKEADAEAQRTPKTSPTAAAAKASAQPAVTQTPQPSQTEAPAAPSVSNRPEAPTASVAPEKPEATENQEKPENQGSTENTEKPEVSESPETPEASENPSPEPSAVPSSSPVPSEEPEPSIEPSPSPVPSEEPEPSEKPYQPTCTISICCQTALDNSELCKDGVLECLPESGWLLDTVTVDIQEGDTVFSILQRVCGEYGIAMEYKGVAASAYIQGIGGLYEFDAGNQSGWVYFVNEWCPNYGCSGYTVSDGDVICWRYTCDLGWDVGGGW